MSCTATTRPLHESASESGTGSVPRQPGGDTALPRDFESDAALPLVQRGRRTMVRSAV